MPTHHQTVETHFFREPRWLGYHGWFTHNQDRRSAQAVQAAAVELDIAALYKRELTLLSSYSSYPPDFPVTLRLLQSRKVRAAEMVTHLYGLDGLDRAIDAMIQKTGIKQLILPRD